MALLALTAKPNQLKPTQFTFQSTKFERLNTTITCPDLTPLDAAHLIAPLLTPYLNITTLPEAGCFEPYHRISLNVAKTDIQHAAIEAEGFHFNNQHFTSDDIRQALLHTYPERFL